MIYSSRLFQRVGLSLLGLAVLGYACSEILSRYAFDKTTVEIKAPPIVDAIGRDATLDEIEVMVAKDSALIDQPVFVNYYVIHFASGKGRFDVVAMLLDKGADPNQRGGLYQETPLVSAINSENEDVVKLLLDRGADPAMVMSDGVSILDHAREVGSEPIIKIIKQALTQ